jgi:hypothetical protein
MRSQELWSLRCKVLSKYGSICTRPGCHCDTPEFLQIDHIDGDGEEERKRTRKRGSVFYRELLNGPRRADLRVLCANCHFAVTWGDACPHVHMMPGVPANVLQKPWDIHEHMGVLRQAIHRECGGLIQSHVAPSLNTLQHRVGALEEVIAQKRTLRPWMKPAAIMAVMVAVVVWFRWWW